MNIINMVVQQDNIFILNLLRPLQTTVSNTAAAGMQIKTVMVSAR